jgi:hypothetical protein
MMWLINKMCDFWHQRIHVWFWEVASPRITAWVAISSHGLLGPVLFEETFNSERYLSMLHNTFVAHLLATSLRTTLHRSLTQSIVSSVYYSPH